MAPIAWIGGMQNLSRTGLPSATFSPLGGRGAGWTHNAGRRAHGVRDREPGMNAGPKTSGASRHEHKRPFDQTLSTPRLFAGGWAVESAAILTVSRHTMRIAYLHCATGI